MRTVLLFCVVILISSCDKSKCDLEIQGEYNILGSNPSDFYMIVDAQYFNLVDVNAMDTTPSPYEIDCEEICLNGLCNEYTFKNGVLEIENALTYTRR